MSEQINEAWNEVRKEARAIVGMGCGLGTLLAAVEAYGTACAAEAVRTTSKAQQPLTDEQIIRATDEISTTGSAVFIQVARAIEAAHGIGVGGTDGR